MGDERARPHDAAADRLAKVVEQAVRLQRSAQAAVDESRKAVEELKAAGAAVPKLVQFEIDRLLKDSAKSATEANVQILNGTRASAEKTMAAFRKIERRASWKVGFLAAGVLSLVALTAVALAYCLTPTLDEIRALRMEREALIDDQKKLKAAGADAQLRTCIDPQERKRLCVRVNDAVQVGAGYKVLFGH